MATLQSPGMTDICDCFGLKGGLKEQKKKESLARTEVLFIFSVELSVSSFALRRRRSDSDDEFGRKTRRRVFAETEATGSDADLDAARKHSKYALFRTSLTAVGSLSVLCELDFFFRGGAPNI